MTRQALYLKWRPQTFDDVIGQEHITRTLRNSIDSGRIRHAYLFSGPRGTGKTTTARLLAYALGCQNLDLIEIDAASHTGVDDVRDLRDKIAFMPTEGQYKTYIIDEVHRFSGSAFDALLKTLEEPPEHAIFVLATTEIDKVPDTIKSRCLMFEFRRVALTEVADRLQFIAESEEINIDRDALELIARQGTGSVRDSISLLDQIVADPEEHITLAITERILGTAKSETVLGLADAILRADTVNGLHIINTAVDSGSDPKQFGQQVVEHLRGVLLAQTSSADLIEASEEMRAIYTEQATMVDKNTLLRAVRAFSEAVSDQRGGWHPQLALELALVESTHERAPLPVDAPQMSGGLAIDIASIEAHIERIVDTRLAMAGSTPAQPIPTAAPTEPPAPPVGSSTPAVIPLSEIQSRWGETIKAVKVKSVILGALLEHVNIVGINGNVITLGVQNDVFVERLSNPDHRSLLNYVLNYLHKTPLQYRVIVGTEDTAVGEGVDIDNPLIAEARKLGAEVHPHHDKHDE